MNLRDNNIIFNSLKEAEVSVTTTREIPPGYIEIRLSTKGKLGAPSVFHVRNFKVSDVVALAMTSEAELPARLADVLNNMIFEDEDVSKWHEKEIEELMVYIFKTFYKNTLDNIPFPLNDDDYEVLGKTPERLEDVKSGRWTPQTSINIEKDVEIYDIPNNFNSKIKITNKNTGFYCVFDFIHYGDQLIIKRWLDSYYAEEEAKFKKIKNQIQFNTSIVRQLKDNPEAVEKIVKYDVEEEKAYNEYLTERLKTLSEVARIVSIVDYNGQDISNLSVGDKYELLKDEARIDYGLISKLNNKQQKMKFGIMPEVNMKDPITGEVVKRPFSFRLSIILQAMQLSGFDNYDDGDDD